jgi:hypothetical protein
LGGFFGVLLAWLDSAPYGKAGGKSAGSPNNGGGTALIALVSFQASQASSVPRGYHCIARSRVCGYIMPLRGVADTPSVQNAQAGQDDSEIQLYRVARRA